MAFCKKVADHCFKWYHIFFISCTRFISRIYNNFLCTVYALLCDKQFMLSFSASF